MNPVKIYSINRQGGIKVVVYSRWSFNEGGCLGRFDCTFGTCHNQGFIYLSTKHASGYIEKRIGNLMNSTINRGSSGRVHVDID